MWMNWMKRSILSVWTALFILSGKRGGQKLKRMGELSHQRSKSHCWTRSWTPDHHGPAPHLTTLYYIIPKKKKKIWSLSPTYFPDQTVLLIFVHTCVAKEGISIHFCVQGSSKHTCCPRNTVGRSGAACTGIFTGTTGDFSKMKVKGQTWHTKPPLAVTKHATFHILSQFDDGRVKIITMRKSKLIHL